MIFKPIANIAELNILIFFFIQPFVYVKSKCWISLIFFMFILLLFNVINKVEFVCVWTFFFFFTFSVVI